MTIAKRPAGAGAVLASLFLAACGGGGGGGSSPPPPPPPPSPPPYTLTPTTAQASFVAGYPSNVVMTARQTVAFTGVAYISVTADSAVVESPISVTVGSDSSATVTLQPLASLAAGHYAGNFTVNVCTDVNCAHPLSGAPFKVPYDFTVISPDGGVTPYKLSTLSPLSGAGDWGTFQGNASHTGYVPVTLDASAFSRRWRMDAPATSGVQWTLSDVTTGGGQIYVSDGGFPLGMNSGSHDVFAYKESDGSKAWSHSFNDLYWGNTNPPAYSNGKVYIAAGSQQYTSMFAFDAATGTQLYKSQMASQWENYLAPTVLDGTVYTDGGSYGGMYAFDATSGSQTFFANAQQYDGWTPAVDATRAYAYTGGVLSIYDSHTGAALGSITDPTFSWLGYTIHGAPVLGAANVVYAANLGNAGNNSIVSFDTASDTVRWTASGPFAGNPAYDNGVLYATHGSPLELEALSEADGSKLWTWTPPAGSGSFVGDVLLTRNLLFVSTTGGTYAIDRATHATVWSDPASGALALSANGVLYVQSAHTIVAINLK